MKKIYLLFLLALLPLLASAETVEINGIRYDVNPEAKTAEVTQPSSGKYSGDIVIPKSVTFKNTVCKVTSIGFHAFYGCNGMTSITIPNSVTHIGEGAFNECSGLTSITIPNSVTYIDEYAFSYCSSLTSIKVESGNAHYDSRNNCNAIIEDWGNSSVFLVLGCKNTIIPDGVTFLGGYAFTGCSGLTSIIIPNSVTDIGDATFLNCRDLTSVTIPNSVTSIGNIAFSGTAWYNNQPDGIVYAGKVLYKYKGTMPGGTNLSIEEGTLGVAGGAFGQCSGLTSVTIPSSVTDIGSYAFSGCSNLATVTIGNGIKHIHNAFTNCSKLTDFYCFAKNVPSSFDNAFNGSYINYATLHVPTGSLDAYKAESPWNGFKEIMGVTAKVKLSKSEATIEKGKTMTITSTVSPTSLSDKSVIWKSSNTKIATVTSTGKVKGVKAGTATITCTSVVTGAKATCKVTVFSGSVSLDKAELSLEKGKTVVLTPTVLPATLEDKSVTWKSSDTDIATVSSAGKVKGIKAGKATITCTVVATGAKATCEVTVGYVNLNKTEAIIQKTKTLTLKATVYPSSLEDKNVTWKSSNTAVATVSSSGKVKGIKAGKATITCTSVATGLKTTCKVTVGYVKLDQTEVAVNKGKTLTLTPTVYPSSLEDKSVTWKSSDTNIATVTSSGKVKGVKPGKATITCTSVATGLSTTCGVTVGYVKLDQTEAIVKKGKTLTLIPTVYPSLLEDKSVTWESSNTAVATVTAEGKVKGVKAGTATITCTSVATGLSTTCKVTVGYVKLGQTELIVKKGNTTALTATVYPSALDDKSVTWKSSNTTVATVTSSGKVKGIKAGTATITCTSVATGLSATCNVTVGYVKLDKSEFNVEKDKTVTLKATVYPSSLEDKSVTWESSNTAVATVTSAGKVKGVKTGVAAITCTSNATGLSTICIVTVVNGSVTLSKSKIALEKGKTLTLTATVTPTTLSDKSVTWKSSNTAVATVTSAGKVKAIKEGTATITCTSNATGLSATCKVTVGKVVINMPELTLRKNGTVMLSATVYPTSLADKSVTWKSSDATVATVTSAGKVKGIKAGTATITCTSIATGLSGTCDVTVLASSGSRSMGGDDDDTTGILSLEDDPAEIEPFDVYDLSGRKVAHQVTTLEGLPDGIYIVNGKKMLKK